MSDGGREQPLRAGPLLLALNVAGVDFVVIGGLAGMAQGSSYPSFDLDIAYARDRPNLERLASVLAGLDVSLTKVPADLPFVPDAQTLENGANFTFDTKHGRFDILGHVPGIRDYAALRAEPVVAPLDGVDAPGASLDHLIVLKRASNSAHDQRRLQEHLVMADGEQGSAQGDQDE